MRLLDLFCCGGGASMGYSEAGFEVTGVDLYPQKCYPFPFIQANVLDLTAEFLQQFDAVAASPPCQAFTTLSHIHNADHPNLIPQTRKLLQDSGLPYIIENVVGAPLENPVMLCGTMFGLGVIRHRLFESNIPLVVPEHPKHVGRTTKLGAPPQEGDTYISVAGHFSGIAVARKAMGINWMRGKEMSQAIPPAYTEYLGTQLMMHLKGGVH